MKIYRPNASNPLPVVKVSQLFIYVIAAHVLRAISYRSSSAPPHARNEYIYLPSRMVFSVAQFESHVFHTQFALIHVPGAPPLATDGESVVHEFMDRLYRYMVTALFHRRYIKSSFPVISY